MKLSIGDTAPDFSLRYKNETGFQSVTLSSHFGKGPVVLLFFPLAFTSVCLEEMCIVRDDFSSYTDLDASVYGISVDSPFTLEVMAQRDGIPFPLLSDFNKDVSTAYGSIYDEFIGLSGVSKRSAFVVDSDGKIAYASVSDDAHVLPDFSAIKAALS